MQNTIIWAYSTESPSLMGTDTSMERGLIPAYLRKRQGNPALGTPLGATWEDLLETGLASEAPGGPLFAESSGTAFLPCPFLTLSLVCWEDLGHPVLSLPDYFPTPWGRRCDIGAVRERETGCWFVGSISWFIHVIRIVQLFCQFCTGCFL